MVHKHSSYTKNNKNKSSSNNTRGWESLAKPPSPSHQCTSKPLVCMYIIYLEFILFSKLKKLSIPLWCFTLKSVNHNKFPKNIERWLRPNLALQKTYAILCRFLPIDLSPGHIVEMGKNGNFVTIALLIICVNTECLANILRSIIS